MRPLRSVPALPLALVLAVLTAGCANPLAGDEPAAATEDPAAIDVASAPSEAPASSGSPSSSPSPSPSSAGSTGTSNQSASAPAPTPVPPPPTMVAWNLTGSASLGWVAAVGTSDAGAPSPVPGQTDASHCPDATFTLPGGAASLRIVVHGEPATPAQPGAGVYDIIVTAPDGTAIRLEPPMDSVPPATTMGSAHELEILLPGIWALHAEPIGPAAQQVWTVALEAAGESLFVPSDLAVVAGC